MSSSVSRNLEDYTSLFDKLTQILTDSPTEPPCIAITQNPIIQKVVESILTIAPEKSTLEDYHSILQQLIGTLACPLRLDLSINSVSLIPCGHFFDKRSFEEWNARQSLQNTLRCPTCQIAAAASPQNSLINQLVNCILTNTTLI